MGVRSAGQDDCQKKGNQCQNGGNGPCKGNQGSFVGQKAAAKGGRGHHRELNNVGVCRARWIGFIWDALPMDRRMNALYNTLNYVVLRFFGIESSAAQDVSRDGGSKPANFIKAVLAGTL